MNYLSAISLLFFQIVCINITAISSNQKQYLADTLDHLLRFPGWRYINDRAKYQTAAHEIKSFSGMDLYDLDLNSNDVFDKNLDNRIVNVENVDTKYNMMIHLLGCVYTKAMLTFSNLLNIMVMECRKQKRRSRDITARIVRQKIAKHNMYVTKKERALIVNDIIDFTNSKKVFYTAMELLENHTLMLDLMSTALHYLIGFTPLEKMQNELMQDLQKIKFQINEIKSIPGYMKVVISFDDTTCKKNDKYRKELKIFSDIVSKSYDINKDGTFFKFKNKHCILPDNRRIRSLYKIYQSDIIVEEMEKLKNEVCIRFYKNLGFMYINQTTILAPIWNL